MLYIDNRSSSSDKYCHVISNLACRPILKALDLKAKALKKAASSVAKKTAEAAEPEG